MSNLGIDAGPVSDWLTEHVRDLAQPLRFSRLAGGRSNLTFLVTDTAGRRVVLRRPPLGDLPTTAHDVVREGRLLGAIADDVPVPEVLAICEDRSVTGAPFVALTYLDGLVLRDPASAVELLPEDRRGRVGPQLIDAMVALHGIDPARLGLDHLARRRDYLERQLRRWHGNWQRTRTRELPDLARTHQWLAEHAPPQRRSSIVHGDFRVDNVMFDATGKVLGILDWELTTIGDPLADLGQLLVYWAEPDDERTALHAPPTRTPGYAARAELRERYLSATGADESTLEYFVTFNWWKTACIVEDVYSRMLRGAMGTSDRSAGSFGDQARALAAAAARRTGLSGR